ncbi:Rho1 guanine nucleotide exchange factor 2 [Smittium culicis]|uniref:Rho1 guanine nucleotide exchange factor 2 n=2 Tax=Smittium culicis TaxID=133412 RepID=A0A1R1X955_9FUNG|nr:Rho1 guanine nucleotide exchange factor 2 [Smittium culicis]OMJ11161.1 Rho1 guanine nucleotide exchange factor 2 [Smittium culicis]
MQHSYKNIVKYNDPLKQSSGKLASPGLELKQKFLNSLVIGNFYYHGIKYSGAFTGRHAIDTISESFGLPDRLLSLQVAKKLDKYNIYQAINNDENPENNSLIDSSEVIYILTKEAFSCLLPDSSVLLINNKIIKISTSPQKIPQNNPYTSNNTREINISSPKTVVKFPTQTSTPLVKIGDKSLPKLSQKYTNAGKDLTNLPTPSKNKVSHNIVLPSTSSISKEIISSPALSDNWLSKSNSQKTHLSYNRSSPKSSDKSPRIKSVADPDLTLKLNLDFERKLSIDIDKLINDPRQGSRSSPSSPITQNNKSNLSDTNIYSTDKPRRRESPKSIIKFSNASNTTDFFSKTDFSTATNNHDLFSNIDFSTTSNSHDLFSNFELSANSQKPDLPPKATYFLNSDFQRISDSTVIDANNSAYSSNDLYSNLPLTNPNSYNQTTNNSQSTRHEQSDFNNNRIDNDTSLSDKDSARLSIAENILHQSSFNNINHKIDSDNESLDSLSSKDSSKNKSSSNENHNTSHDPSTQRHRKKRESEILSIFSFDNVKLFNSNPFKSIAQSMGKNKQHKKSNSVSSRSSSLNSNDNKTPREAKEPPAIPKKQSFSTFLNKSNTSKSAAVEKDNTHVAKKSSSAKNSFSNLKKNFIGKDPFFFSQQNKVSTKLQKYSKSAINLNNSDQSAGISKKSIEISPNISLSAVKRPSLWAYSVPQEVVSSLTPEQIGWQESIYETIGTESDYVHDLKLIDQIYINPLKSSNIIPQNRFDSFTAKLFLNYKQLIKINAKLLEELEARQSLSPNGIISGVGDIFYNWSKNLDPFIYYSSNVQFSQVLLEAEMHENEKFSNFVYSTESNVLARKLPIQNFIGRPTAKLARYPMLLSSILKRTPKVGFENEISNLKHVIEVVKSALEYINDINSSQSDKLRMMRLSTQIRTTAEEAEILDIQNENRRLLLEDDFYRNDGSILHAFLFDNCFILANKKKVSYAKGVFEYIVQKGPLPLMLLNVSSLSSNINELVHPLVPRKTPFSRLPTIINKQSSQQSSQSNSQFYFHHFSSSSSFAAVPNSSGPASANSLTPVNSSNNVQNYQKSGSYFSSSPALASKKSNSALSASNFAVPSVAPVSTVLKPGNVEAMSNCVPLTFGMISKLGWEVTLWAINVTVRNSWVDRVNEQVQILNNLTSSKLSYNLVAHKSNLHLEATCMSEYKSHSGEIIKLVGAIDGIFLIKSSSMDHATKVCSLSNIVNLAILENFNMVIVQYEKTVVVIPLNELENLTSLNLQNRGTKLASSVSYFNVGVFHNEPLLVLMKFRNSRSYYKCLVPIMASTNSSLSSNSMLVYQNYPFALNVIHEFCIPGQSSRVFFFKRKLCIANGNCFDVVDLVNKVITQSLPSSDACLADGLSVIGGNRTNSGSSAPGIKSLAMAIYRVNKLFLLCFEDYALYIDRMGQLTQPNLVINFLVKPISFKFVFPNYLVIVGKLFIEIRYVDSGNLFLILRIPGAHILDDNQLLLSSSSKQKLNTGNNRSGISGANNSKKSVFLSIQSKYLPQAHLQLSTDDDSVINPDTDRIDSPYRSKSVYEVNEKEGSAVSRIKYRFDAESLQTVSEANDLIAIGQENDFSNVSSNDQNVFKYTTPLTNSVSLSPQKSKFPGFTSSQQSQKNYTNNYNMEDEPNPQKSGTRHSSSITNLRASADYESSNRFHQSRQASQSAFIARHKPSLNNLSVSGSNVSGSSHFFSSFLSGSNNSNRNSSLFNIGSGSNGSQSNYNHEHYCIVELVLP